MVKLVKAIFDIFFEIGLWLTLIVCAIAGGIIGNNIGAGFIYSSGNVSSGHPFLGVFIGLIVGLLINIIFGGLAATALSIDEDLELFVAKLSNTGNASGWSSFGSTHRVKLLTNADGLGLRKEPNASADPFTRIPNNTEVQQINTGGLAKLGDKEGEWFEIKTKDGVQGWCFSGSLEKI